MKVNELVGYKQKPEYQVFKNPPPIKNGSGDSAQFLEVINKLNELGYKQYSIGSGYYAQVYARPQDNYVIKIFRDDPGYAAFLRYVTKNANNPYVPKLKGKVVNLPNKHSLVRLEKLKRIDVDLFKQIEYAAFNPHDKPLVNELNEKYPGLLDFVYSLRALANKDGVGLDLNRNNMMMRGDTPVITDPFAG
jgi:hypothetical protein